MKTVRTTLALALAATLSIATGCKTTSWTMPGKSLFSWNKKPDDSMVASNSEMPQYPSGPAAKYDPATIQSVGAQTQGSGSRTGSPYGFAQTVSTPTTNLAAQANGYTYPQTGAYQTATTGTATTGAATTGQAASAGLPSPYGSGYTDTTAAAGSTARASAVTPTSYPALPAGNSGSTGYGSTNPISSYPALPAGSAGSTTAPATTAPATTGYQGSTTLPNNAAGYAPGTTSRSTNYNFGTSGGTSSAGSQSFSLPSNTASGANSLYR